MEGPLLLGPVEVVDLTMRRLHDGEHRPGQGVPSRVTRAGGSGHRAADHRPGARKVRVVAPNLPILGLEAEHESGQKAQATEAVDRAEDLVAIVGDAGPSLRAEFVVPEVTFGGTLLEQFAELHAAGRFVAQGRRAVDEFLHVVAQANRGKFDEHVRDASLDHVEFLLDGAAAHAREEARLHAMLLETGREERDGVRRARLAIRVERAEFRGFQHEARADDGVLHAGLLRQQRVERRLERKRAAALREVTRLALGMLQDEHRGTRVAEIDDQVDVDRRRLQHVAPAEIKGHLTPFDDDGLGRIALDRGVILVVIWLLGLAELLEIRLLHGTGQGFVVGPAAVARAEIGLHGDPEAFDALVAVTALAETVAQILQHLRLVHLGPGAAEVIGHVRGPGATLRVAEFDSRVVRRQRAGIAVLDDHRADVLVDHAERIRPEREEEHPEARIGHQQDFFVKGLHGD